MESQTVFRTSLRGLEKLHEGKVRDIYSAGADALLIVTTDRLSAFDVVLPDPIPGKGRVLNEISNFWFERTRHIVPNHLTGRAGRRPRLRSGRARSHSTGRAVIVRRLKALPLEAVVRGYLIGSGWKDYQKTGGVCGVSLPAQPSSRLAAAGADIHAGDQGGRRGARREHLFRRGREAHRGAARGPRPRYRHCALRVRGGARAQPRHHHRRHEVRVRSRRGRHARL